MNEALPSLEHECFFVAPIGSEGSDTRERSDGVLEYIVVPAVQPVGLTAVRADKIAKPGQITRQVIEHVVGAKAAVVDLTDANPNVYYKMAVRHTAQLPTVLIAQEGEKLPFDIAQMRTIFFDHTSLKSAAECRNQITQHLQEALGGEVDSPIAASVTVQRLEQGTAQERVLAQLVDGMDEVRALRHIDRPRGPRAVMPAEVLRDLDRGFHALQHYRDTHDPDALEAATRFLGRGVSLAFRREYMPGERIIASERELRDRELRDAARQEDRELAERQAERDAGREAEREAEREAGREVERQAEREAAVQARLENEG